MARSKTLYRTFNRGLVSPRALARTDIERVGLSASTFDNFMPRRLGNMMFRPGTQFLASTNSDNKARFIPFVFAADDKALLELTATTMRVWVSDAVVTRNSVSTSVTNGGFSSALGAEWVDNDEGGSAASTRVTSGAKNYLRLEGDGTNAAIRRQSITISSGDQNVEHGLAITINEPDRDATGALCGGFVRFRLGTTEGNDDLITETELGTGYHSLAFTPTTGTVWIEFANRENRIAHVQDVSIESSGDLTITTPWPEADLGKIRYDQSADVVYVACEGHPGYKIVRRGTRSWSVVEYEPLDGPFGTINTSPITITPSALAGSVTLTASGNLWKSTDPGRLVKVISNGQQVTLAISAENTFTNTIKVSGASNARIFRITITGTWTATVTLQRSVTASDSGFVDVTSYTTNQDTTYDDGLDNQIAWYKIGIKTGDYSSGTATCTLDYAAGGIEGIARITTYTSATVVTAITIDDFGATDAQLNWHLGEWSASGFPSSVSFHEGRLAWAGKSSVWLSESDGYEDFDDNTLGDSQFIKRTIGAGPVDVVNWMVSADQLLLGTDSAEFRVRSSGDDEVLTPTNANIRDFSTHGSAQVQPSKVDRSAIFIERNGTRVMEAGPDDQTFAKYRTTDLTILYPEAGEDSKIVHTAVQRQPDTRIHCVRNDGTVAILVHDPVENISCWVTLSTTGTVEDVVVLPGDDGDPEDHVYYVVKRTINAVTKRYLEKWALESECEGGTTNRNADSFIIADINNGTLGGLDHLEGETVTVWGNGKDLGTYTVSSATITSVLEDGATATVTNACIGLAYTAQFQSTKLESLLEKKNIKRIGVILRNTHYQGLQYGPDFTNLRRMPLISKGKSIADDTVHSTFDEETFAFDGRWDTDARMCLQATSPRPVNILCAIIEVEE